MRRTKHEHRPHRKKREHERYHCAQLVRDYRKQQRRAEAEREGERPHKRALVDDEAAAATHPRVDEPQRKVQRPRGQPRPSAFSKELRAAAHAARAGAGEVEGVHLPAVHLAVEDAVARQVRRADLRAGVLREVVPVQMRARERGGGPEDTTHQHHRQKSPMSTDLIADRADESLTKRRQEGT